MKYIIHYDIAAIFVVLAAMVHFFLQENNQHASDKDFYPVNFGRHSVQHCRFNFHLSDRKSQGGASLAALYSK